MVVRWLVGTFYWSVAMLSAQAWWCYRPAGISSLSPRWRRRPLPTSYRFTAGMLCDHQIAVQFSSGSSSETRRLSWERKKNAGGVREVPASKTWQMAAEMLDSYMLPEAPTQNINRSQTVNATLTYHHLFSIEFSGKHCSFTHPEMIQSNIIVHLELCFYCFFVFGPYQLLGEMFGSLAAKTLQYVSPATC